jgi:tetratricopeptide (TPR) repeat protein
LKKETVTTAITALVFLVVGFLAGYIYESHRKTPTPAAVVAPADAPSGGTAQTGLDTSAQGSAAGGVQGLPPGHPPLNLDSTIKAFEDAAAQNPQDPDPALRLANLFYDNQRFQDAAEWYEKALKLDPKNVNARTDLGTVYFSLGRTEDALAEYKKSLQIDPRHEPTIFNTIIVNLEGTHDLAAARAAWEKLHAMNPDYKGLDGLKQRLDAAQGAGSRP